LSGAPDEIGKPGVTGTDKAPHKPHDKDHTDDIAGPHMHAQQVILGQIRHEKGGHQNPVPNPDERVPDTHDRLSCGVHRDLSKLPGRRRELLASGTPSEPVRRQWSIPP
jgi:hypothetical protein